MKQTSRGQPLLSIVVPLYQNEQSLPHTTPKLLELIESIDTHQSELIFVDDGSTDRSFELASQYQKQNPAVIRIVKLTRNYGQTPATQAGLAHCKGDCAVIISADLQDPYQRIPEMLKHWLEGAKYVLAYREDRDESKLHAFISGLYWKLIANFGIKGFPRSGYDFCLLDRQVIDEINKIAEKNTSIFPLIYWLGYQPTLMPITRRERQHGTSQWTFLKKVRLTLDTLFAFTYLPVRIITYSAIGTALASTTYFSWVLIRWLAFGSPVRGWTSIVLISLCLGSVTLFALGILCEYVWRILDEIRKRPNYVVELVEEESAP